MPDPPQLVNLFARLLRPGGQLIVSAPFFLVSGDFLTHLKSNCRYSGSWSGLYRPHGFALVDGRLDWSPLVFVKTPPDPGPATCGSGHRLALKAMGLFFRGARWWSAPYAWLAKLSGTSRSPWLEGLAPDTAD